MAVLADVAQLRLSISYSYVHIIHRDISTSTIISLRGIIED